MPKVNLTEADRMRDRLGTLLRVEMARGDVTTQRVADKLGRCAPTVRGKLRDPGSLTVNELGQLVRMLHIRREDLTDAIYGK